MRGDIMYPNPYMISQIPKTSLLTKGISAIKSINWSTLLDGTQKTLGVINQAIPVVYQIKPIVSNAKTIFRIADSLKSDDTPTQNIVQPEQSTPIPTPTPTPTQTNNSPIFYI